MEPVALVTLAALIEYFVFASMVGAKRAEVPPPAMTGDQAFERRLRVQLNTLERLIIFIPALWLFGHFTSSTIAAYIGVVWIVARILFAAGYLRDPAKRVPGMILTALSEMVLIVGAAWGILT